jgi:ATP-dependent Clp protease ATP-binding subunit ClpC
MFERFTDRAQRVVILAQEEARLLGHNYVGTEHLLLGLIREDADGDGDVAAKVLEPLGIRRETVRQQIEQMIGRGRHDPSGQIPFTPRATRVLELAQREANDLHDGVVDSAHLFLGLIREQDGIAAQVLVEFGANLKRVRQQVIQLAQAR